MVSTFDHGGYSHRGDGGGRTGVSGEGGEGSGGARLLDVGVGEASREVRSPLGRRGGRDDLRAVNEFALAEAEDGHLAEGLLELGLKLVLVVCTISC